MAQYTTLRFSIPLFVFTRLLLGHSRSAHLFGMFFRYRWRYLCFLPTFCSSRCLVGIGEPHKSQSFCSRQDARVRKMVGGGGCHMLTI